MKNRVLIPADGYRGDRFYTYRYESRPGRSWAILEGEGLKPGREITRGALDVMLRSGAWRIVRNHPHR
jgi:hypothetical protein